ncbi:MAG: hypothetical protein GEV06_13950 [Luteitalea sp.]|nr:hypothetical protein [Luteitalea sp.]
MTASSRQPPVAVGWQLPCYQMGLPMAITNTLVEASVKTGNTAIAFLRTAAAPQVTPVAAHGPYRASQCSVLLARGHNDVVLASNQAFLTNRGAPSFNRWGAAALLNHPQRSSHPLARDARRSLVLLDGHEAVEQVAIALVHVGRGTVRQPSASLEIQRGWHALPLRPHFSSINGWMGGRRGDSSLL